MQLPVLAVFDDKTKVFCSPFTAQTISAALRDFAYAANDLDSNIGRYPSDFSLFHIGNYDDETATLIPLTMSSLGTAIQFVQQTEVTQNV